MMREQPEQEQEKRYKSPQRKLVTFFEKSRDAWKAKCREAKKTVKRLKNRIRFLEQSKERWKSRVGELESEMEQMRAQQRSLEAEVATLQKKLRSMSRN